jgi:Tfp pilus tip-associated adhesin PilY1
VIKARPLPIARVALARGAIALVFSLGSWPVMADDKDLLKHQAAAPNVMIVFGNSQTTEQPIQGSTSAWDGDGDSPASKMGAAKRIVRQFLYEKHSGLNVGLTTFAHDPNAGSITIHGKHWLYSPLTVDFPLESWKEPAGTIERWGVNGEGPCTSVTVPACTDRSPAFVTLPSNATVAGPFFGNLGTGTAFIYLDGNTSSATLRIAVTLTGGRYGDAFSDGNLSAYSIFGTHSMEVTKVYQKLRKIGKTGIWEPQATTPNGSPGTVTIFYVPAASLTPDLFYTVGSDAGKAIGFLNDPKTDFDVNASCSGWEFQVGSAPLPLVRIPRDYRWGTACSPAQDSYPCVTRLLRPQAKLTRYDQGSGIFTTTDPDNPGYTGIGSKYADGCDSTLLGAVDAGLDIVENQAILTTRNGSQAPIKNLLQDIYAYFNNPSIDGFKNGTRTDDPDAACRTSAVILIYDNFNGCQNDNCSFLTNQVLTPLKQIGVPVFVVGLGSSATATSATGICIAQNSGAVLQDGTTVGYFPVTTPDALYQALVDISTLITESSKVFAASSVASAQVMGDQMVYFANFNAASNRSIWNGRVNGYKLDGSGNIRMGQLTINDKNDPHNGVTLPAPSNDPSSLIWNAGMNLLQTPGTGATNPAAVLAPGAAISTGTYSDNSNDTATTIGTSFYPGRKIVFSLPQGYANPVTTLPIPASNAVPENRYDMTYSTTASWWPALRALLGPQTAPPAVLSPPLSDSDAGNSLRFIWGDRDAVMTTTQADQRYIGLKLGDIFHSAPVLVGRPNEFAYFSANVNNYKAFLSTYRQRRRVLFAGANDGLLHAFDAGVFDRNPSACQKQSDGSDGHCYDLGTGAELFAYAPRAVMQIYKPLKDAVGAQSKHDEWTVDGSPTVADVFLDASSSGTPNPSHRAWHTVLVGSTREGSPFEGTSGARPFDTRGSYFALDVTQPDELAVDGNGLVGPAGPGTFAAPLCLNASGNASCGKDAADTSVRASQPARDWPTVLWEISDTGDQDSASSPGAGYPDMGESWSKPAMGRVRVCTADCGNTSAPLPVTEDRYVAIFGGGFDRERLNRRGNWLSMIDVETGRALYRANSSCGVNSGTGSCTPKFFGSVASEPAAIDFNGDGYLDLLYVGDLKGQLWRIDLSDLRFSASPPGGRFNNQLDLTSGSGRPFLLFQAPQPLAPATTPFYPFHYRPMAVSLGFNVAGRPALGLAFGSGDRDDILAILDGSSLNYKQRFYYVVDRANSTTLTESDLMNIASPTAPSVSAAPERGWFLELANGERVSTNSLAAGGVVFFSTFNPLQTGSPVDSCSNGSKCQSQGGVSRFYSVLHATGNPYQGTDRGETQENAIFASDPILFMSADQLLHILYTTENSIPPPPPAPTGKTITIKSWKESTRQP